MQKGEQVRLKIQSLEPGGDGVSKDLGIPVFISRVAPEDVVDVELFDVRKGFARGHMVQLIEPSPHRSEPPCPLFKVCGGCQWQHMTYEYQLDAKKDLIVQALKHIGGLEGVTVLPTLASEQSLLYRNKAQFPVKHPKNSGRILAGYYKQDTHELVNIKHCPVQPRAMDVVLERAKEVWQNNDLSAYDEKSHSGLLRHINLRYSFELDQVLLVFVLNCLARDEEDLRKRPFFSDAMAAAQELMDSTKEVVGVCFNCNPYRGNKILGDFTYCAAGKERIEEVLRTSRADLPERLQKGLRFSLSSTSFFQINTQQAVKLLETVYAGVAEMSLEAPFIIDAYAGVGAISLWLAGLGGKIIAIEDHPAAVEDAKNNAALNHIDNVNFELGAVEDVLPGYVDSDVDVIIIDPPRKGMSPKALEAVVQARPKRIIYVSCNPVTLARDLQIIEQMRLQSGADGDNNRLVGYKTKQIRPIDLFPQTFHVESVTVIERFLC